jgi:hypothetical protein
VAILRVDRETSQKEASPQHILAYAGSIWNMSDTPSNSWAALPIARIDSHGDDIGFLREGEVFGSTVYLLDHEKEWYAERQTGWAERRADSLADLIRKELERGQST